MTETLAITRTKLKLPAMWRVDVSGKISNERDLIGARQLISGIFQHSDSQSASIVEQIKLNGKATAGLYAKETATTKAHQASASAAQMGLSLKAEIQPS